MSAMPLRLRSGVVLALVTVIGLMMLGWPLILRVDPSDPRVDPPFLFLLLLPLLLAVVLAELSEGGMDARALAILGVLSAVNAALRGFSAGTGGLELVFFLLILGGRVFGPGFGFILGCTSLLGSALLTAGVGPWLPFQMLVAGWVGLGAGLLPRRPRGRAEIVVLVAYGVAAAYLYGLLMNLWGWPFIAGLEIPGHDASQIAYLPGGPLAENLRRFLVYTLLTSTGGWDTGRAITNAIAIAVLGPSVLATLRRAARKARIERLPEPVTAG